MADNSSPSFDARHLVEQATHIWQQQLNAMPKAFDKAQINAATTQPMLKAFAAAAEALAAEPHMLLQKSLQLHQSYLSLGANFLAQMMGQHPDPVATPEKGDSRFADESWNTAFFDLLKQSYLLTSHTVMDTIAASRQLDESTKEKALFYTRQFVEMLSPSNFLLTNPEALSTALATRGESLLNGMKNLMADMESGHISMTDYSQFAVGENIAVTKGSVVFRNRLIELIQYAPQTKQVHQKPLLICPPWINRYYILDLQPKNSFVNYLVEQGFTVFIISWKNPDASYRDVGFEDYITEGLFTAVDVVRDITGEDSINALGYCIGGTMLSAGLAIMHAKNDKRIQAATFLTTLTDFSHAGELSIFTDDGQITALEKQMQKDGVLDGRSMASTFSALRANDLIWSFVVSNYLLGKQPFPFDILYWNDDSTRMPCAMHSWYLRKLYLENAMATPGKVKLLGTPIDLTKLNLPMYMVSALNDHITPWASCYAPYAKMASKWKRYVLTKAGHVAGVVNPPTPEGKPVKRSFWAGDAGNAYADAWLRTAQQHPDSWWPDYAKWLAEQAGDMVNAPAKQGNAHHKPLCPAPGTYVLEK